jgi:hypothetical protein
MAPPREKRSPAANTVREGVCASKAPEIKELCRMKARQNPRRVAIVFVPFIPASLQKVIKSGLKSPLFMDHATSMPLEIPYPGGASFFLDSC